MINIILCGGSGTRLWPISRTLMPKQFVKLFDDKSLFQLTVERNQSLCEDQVIVSNIEQYFLAQDQNEEIQQIINHSPSNTRYLLEPVGRNTAPAIALACLTLDSEEIILVTPSDHLIKDEASYTKAVLEAKSLAQAGNLVTFGITPTYPETGFGYIEAQGNDVISFKEKPDTMTAQTYLDAGNYYWNSGMFMFQAGVFLEELQKYSPEIYDLSLKAYRNAKKDEIIRIAHEDMVAIPEDSVDYAVMEKSGKVKVVPATIGWSDMGSFESLAEEVPSSENVISIDSSNNLVLSQKFVATIGIEDIIVIDTTDALLISKKGASQKVKEVVKQLNEKDSDLTQTHTLAYRPWGTYEVLLSTDQYKIKRIVVKSGKRLSLQKHFHRNEHWIVVSGTATVTIGDAVKLIRPNESTYIKMGEVHRLENNGKIPVVLIEAQVGEYTGEDDIVRLEDDYNRGEVL